MGISVGNVWHVQPGHAAQPGVVYAGTQPAGLFRSEDWGERWAPVETLNRHEYRQFWGEAGGGDSALHSIEFDPRDPNRMYVSISVGGSYVTHDGGESWQLCSHRVIATNPMAAQMEASARELAAAAGMPESAFEPVLPPGVDPAAANEMHKMRVDLKNPDRLWGQTHVGVFRSDDRAGTWHDVTVGLPSFHGFPIAISKRGEDAVFVVPLEFERDNFRVCAGQFAVYRTRDSGASWQALTDGLPGPHDYQSVYRDGLDTDGLDPEGVYVGTSNGEIYASTNGGDRWQRLPGTLPPILGITAAAW
ncbi:MAG: exo-alpha-sialidase [Chloroflexi bacterium]|nr:exo-alpha-sialidase [Chloroflexota bacterium]